MPIVASTITEYYEEVAKKERKEGMEIGELKGELKSLDNLYQDQLITQVVYLEQRRPLEKVLRELEARLVKDEVNPIL